MPVLEIIFQSLLGQSKDIRLSFYCSGLQQNLS